MLGSSCPTEMGEKGLSGEIKRWGLGGHVPCMWAGAWVDDSVFSFFFSHFLFVVFSFFG